MKKFKIVLLIMFLFMPVIVLAEGIENYYINATVLNNGDIEVEEYFNLTGYYNGMDRIINYKNINAVEFNPYSDSFGGSKIHNGDNITLEEIKGVEINSNFDFNNVSGQIFNETYSGESGDYGVYKITRSTVGDTYRIFLPSSRNEAFYIKYKLHNMAVLHNDIGELGWTVFGTELNESISNLKVTVNIPNNNNLIKVWAHGPLNGESKIISNDKVEATISNLKSNTAIDIRVAFDKEVISNSTKVTNVDALDKIINYENILAYEANKQREAIKEAKIREIDNLFENLDTEPSRYKYNSLNNIINDLDYVDLKSKYSEKLITYQDKVDEYEYNSFKERINDISYNSYELAKYYPEKVFDDALREKMNEELKILKKNVLKKELKLEYTFILISICFLIISYLNLNKSAYFSTIIKNVDPKYIRDAPTNLSPFSAGLLINKKIGKYAISATLLDLIRRNIVTLDKTYKGETLLHLDCDIETLSDSDRNFIKMIFQNSKTLNLKKMKEISNKSFKSWKDNELNILKDNKLIDYDENKKDKVNGDCLVSGIILISTILFAPIGLLLLSIYGFKRYRENVPIFYLILLNLFLGFIDIFINHLTHISIIFIIITTILIKLNLKNTPSKIKMKLTDEGKLERKKLYAFRNFLNDFSRLEEKEIKEVKLWEQYLVYATAFGIGKKVLKSMKIKLENQPDFKENILFDRYNINVIYNSASNVSNRTTTLSAPNIVFTSGGSGGGSSSSGSFSSGSGGGGGFSGGGGSFGGGGGGGRF